MKTLIGAAIVTAAVALAGPVAIDPAAAASAQIKAKTVGASGTTDLGARRYYRHHRYGYRPYYRPHYYARPYYYRPYPYYLPVPFVFGFGFGPFW